MKREHIRILRNIGLFIVVINMISCIDTQETYAGRQKIKEYSNIRWTNIKHGKSIMFYLDGDTFQVSNYRYNKAHGHYVNYYENGFKSEVCEFKKGKINGIAKSYYPNGNIKSIVEYKENKIWNILSYKDINGNNLETNLKNGNGFVYKYDSLGVKISEGKIINGYKAGYWRLFSNTGYVDSIKYEKGKIDNTELESFVF